jgi:hypothetical protein
MSEQLSNEDKLNIAEAHLKNLLYSEYNMQLSLKEAQAAAVPNQSSLDSLNLQLSDNAAQKNAVVEEIDLIKAAIAADAAKATK